MNHVNQWTSPIKHYARANENDHCYHKSHGISFSFVRLKSRMGRQAKQLRAPFALAFKLFSFAKSQKLKQKKKNKIWSTSERLRLTYMFCISRKRDCYCLGLCELLLFFFFLVFYVTIAHSTVVLKSSSTQRQKALTQ